MLNSHNPAGRAVDINLALLRTVAERIGTLREKVTFLGGTILPLLVSEPVASGIRIAKDVDLMVHAPTKAELWEIEDQLWDMGLKRKSLGAACHWRLGDIHVDVLTTERDTVEFVNRWGVEAVRRAQQRDIGGGLLVNVMRSTHYMATKFDAFRNRGNDRYRTSPDIHDIRLVLRGCPDIAGDLEHTSPELRSHLAAETHKLLDGTERGGGEVQDAGKRLMSIQDEAMHRNVCSILKL